MSYDNYQTYLDLFREYAGPEVGSVLRISNKFLLHILGLDIPSAFWHISTMGKYPQAGSEARVSTQSKKAMSCQSALVTHLHAEGFDGIAN